MLAVVEAAGLLMVTLDAVLLSHTAAATLVVVDTLLWGADVAVTGVLIGSLRAVVAYLLFRASFAYSSGSLPGTAAAVNLDTLVVATSDALVFDSLVAGVDLLVLPVAFSALPSEEPATAATAL